jgi:hypothetical protein
MHERNGSIGFTGSATPSGTLGAGLKSTDTAVNKHNEQLPLVHINTAAQNKVREGFHNGCTVEVSRIAFNTMVCGSADALGKHQNPTFDSRDAKEVALLVLLTVCSG